MLSEALVFSEIPFNLKQKDQVEKSAQWTRANAVTINTHQMSFDI